MTMPNEELDRLLAELPANAARRAHEAFDRLAGSRRRIVLFGAGNLGRRTLQGLQQLKHDVVAIADNNASRWGSSVDGVPILAPEEAARRFGRDAVFVVTIWQGGDSTHRFEHTRTQLQRLGCEAVVSFGFLYWKFAGTFLPYYCMATPQALLEEAPRVREAFDLWADETSRQVFLAQVRFNLTLDFDRLTRSPDPEYFAPALFSLGQGDVFVDCGAYDGDTIVAFQQHCKDFGHIVAFEPDPANFARLESRCATLPRERITLFPMAVSCQRGRLSFDASGTMSSRLGTGTLSVETVPLDEVLQPWTPALIKLDVEGAEMEALQGAEQTIRRHAPVLAVTLEHRQEDLWRLPLFMRELPADYDLYLRCHSEQGLDLVCYAVPPGRDFRRGAAK